MTIRNKVKDDVNIFKNYKNNGYRSIEGEVIFISEKISEKVYYNYYRLERCQSLLSRI